MAAVRSALDQLRLSTEVVPTDRLAYFWTTVDWRLFSELEAFLPKRIRADARLPSWSPPAVRRGIQQLPPEIARGLAVEWLRMVGNATVVARTLGVNRSTIQRWRDRVEHDETEKRRQDQLPPWQRNRNPSKKSRRTSARRAHRDARIVELRTQHPELSYAAIAERLRPTEDHASRTTVYKVLRAAGLVAPRRGHGAADAQTLEKIDRDELEYQHPRLARALSRAAEWPGL